VQRLIINGGKRLNGGVTVHGAKNSALPVLAAAAVCDGISVIHNVPMLSDVEETINILRHLGCGVTREGDTVTVDARGADGFEVPNRLMKEMRSSIIFMGALVSRFGKALVSLPGGCNLGPRPIDLHLSALRQMGLIVEEQEEPGEEGRRDCRLDCRVEKPLEGCEIDLTLPSVGATENIMLAASTARGRTVIQNAACEPEISDLADFLNRAGAKIAGAGEPTVVINGVKSLTGAEHTVIPDRITASTYMAAGAVTRGRVTIKKILPAHLRPVFPVFLRAGCELQVRDRELTLTAPARIKSLGNVKTDYYPGFPTDSQPPLLAMSTLADGRSQFVETIFHNRYAHVDALNDLGANIKVTESMAIVDGVKKLTGREVEAADLRGGAALIIAGLAAEGQTVIGGMNYILRGYDDIEKRLAELGADIRLEE